MSDLHLLSKTGIQLMNPTSYAYIVQEPPSSFKKIRYKNEHRKKAILLLIGYIMLCIISLVLPLIVVFGLLILLPRCPLILAMYLGVFGGMLYLFEWFILSELRDSLPSTKRVLIKYE